MTSRATPDPALARWFSFALLGVAGWTDAVGFLLFAGLYVSFMSSDATQLAVPALWCAVLAIIAARDPQLRTRPPQQVQGKSR